MTDSTGSFSKDMVASYWRATASDRTTYARLAEDIETDVAIVGAGFTGLSAAYHLQKIGRRCVILDAYQPGWGASGRNGGMTVPRYKSTFSELSQKHGAEVALRMYRVAHDAVDTVERIVTELAIDCGFARYGHIAPGTRDRGAERFAADVEWLAREAGDKGPRMLRADELAHRIGTDFYKFGFFEPRGAGVHPFRYCSGLAKALSAKGIDIFGDTLVEKWERAGQYIVLTANGKRIRANQLALATNGYADLSRAGDQLKFRVLPILSSVIATAPIPKNLLTRILPQATLVTDVKRLTNYFRIMPDGRLLFGGRGGASIQESPAIYRRLHKEMSAIFPELADIKSEYRWSGRVGMTLNGLPKIGLLDDQVHYAMGYNGRGVALATFLGSVLARRLAGEQVDLGPLSAPPFARIPFYALRLPAKQIGIQYYRFLDAIGM